MPVRAGGLNKMKKIYRKEEGVSPVIATILMVAITVVLAATVYIMVAGMGTGGTNKLVASLSYDSQQSNPGTSVTLRVSMSSPSSAAMSKVKIIVTPSTGSSVTLTWSSTNNDWESSSSTTYKATLMDLDGSGTLSDGDNIVVTGADSGDTISMAITGYNGNAQVTVP